MAKDKKGRVTSSEPTTNVKQPQTGSGPAGTNWGPNSPAGWVHEQTTQGRSWAEIAQEVARWPAADQEQLFLEMDRGGTSRTTDYLQQEVQRVRQDAFKRGERLPGVDATGGGTGLSDAERQAQLASQNIDRTQGILEGMSHDPADYSYQPTVEDKASLGPYAQYNENVDPLVLAQEEWIKQNRSDTTGYDAQGRSLQDLNSVVNEQGLTAIDRARIEQMRQDTARRARAQEGAIQADMAERGRGGGTASMLLRQQAQQAAANDRGLYDMQTAALGLQRKDSAIMGRADIGNQMQMGVDAIDKFNTTQRQDVVNRNVNRQNEGTSTTWTQNNMNRNSNVSAENVRRDKQFEYDTGYNQRGADRQTEAARFNVGPGQGARGAMRDELGVSQSLAGNNEFAANLLTPQGGGGGGGSPGIGSAIGGGVMAGGAAGSTLGPWGAAIGGVVGGTVGGLTYEEEKKK